MFKLIMTPLQHFYTPSLCEYALLRHLMILLIKENSCLNLHSSFIYCKQDSYIQQMGCCFIYLIRSCVIEDSLQMNAMFFSPPSNLHVVVLNIFVFFSALHISKKGENIILGGKLVVNIYRERSKKIYTHVYGIKMNVQLVFGPNNIVFLGLNNF